MATSILDTMHAGMVAYFDIVLPGEGLRIFQKEPPLGGRSFHRSGPRRGSVARARRSVCGMVEPDDVEAQSCERRRGDPKDEEVIAIALAIAPQQLVSNCGDAQPLVTLTSQCDESHSTACGSDVAPSDLDSCDSSGDLGALSTNSSRQSMVSASSSNNLLRSTLDGHEDTSIEHASHLS